MPKLDIPAIALYLGCTALDKAQSANDDWLKKQAIREIRTIANSLDKMIVTSHYTRSRLAGFLEYEQHGILYMLPQMKSSESHPSHKYIDPLP